MNLVAKEFIAARTDHRGALVLSRFTGAARELGDAILVNPYDVDGFAAALFQALSMTDEEQERRMRRLREHVTDQNIYRWAGQLLSSGAKLIGAASHVRLDPSIQSPPLAPHQSASAIEEVYGSKE